MVSLVAKPCRALGPISGSTQAETPRLLHAHRWPRVRNTVTELAVLTDSEVTKVMTKRALERTDETHSASENSAGAELVTIDRRRRERRAQAVAAPAERRGSERRKAPRRRQIDPTTCERDYSNDEVEFMKALDRYKRASGRQFPTCSEILEVIRALGYQKTPTSQPVEIAPEPAAVPLGGEIPGADRIVHFHKSLSS